MCAESDGGIIDSHSHSLLTLLILQSALSPAYMAEIGLHRYIFIIAKWYCFTR